MPNATSVTVKDSANADQTISTIDALLAVFGAVADAAAANGASGTALAYLRALKDAATSNGGSGIYLGTDAIFNNGATLVPKFAKIAASASGATTVVALVASKKIRVLQFWLTGNGAVNANLQSHATTATATGLAYIAAAGGGISAPFSPVGLFETVAGEALDINLSGAVAVGGGILYVEV